MVKITVSGDDVLTYINEALGTLDCKVRLARTVAAERDWRQALVSVWLIAEDTPEPTPRGRTRDAAGQPAQA